MATKAEKIKAEEAKKGVKPKRARKLAQRKTDAEKHEHHESKAAGKKASYAQEAPPAEGKRPSRKSTRKSANRAKADTNLTLRSSRAKRAPTEQARASKRKSAAVRRTTKKG